MKAAAASTVSVLLATAAMALALQEAVPQTSPNTQISLPDPRHDSGVSLEAAIAARRSVREFSNTPLTWVQVGQLAWAAQGITDVSRGLRAAPSAGALYPLEVYLVTPGGCYHYLPDVHKLDRLADRDLRGTLQTAAGGNEAIAQAPLDIVITAVFARTASRFGERAEQFVFMEVGHVAQNIHLQAVALGLGSVPIGGFDVGQVTQALGLPEDHRPAYIIPVGHPLVRPQATR
jgi:SagB-type dehydrogenase family enzyme